jgi:hypothetical protein
MKRLTDFTQNYLLRNYTEEDRATVIVPDRPIDVHCLLSHDKWIDFTIGALIKYNIVYAEPASDGCHALGCLSCKTFEVEGKVFHNENFQSNEEEIYNWFREIIESPYMDPELIDDEMLDI